MYLYQQLARRGWSLQPRVQNYLDTVLAPTAYWWVQQRSKQLRAKSIITEYDKFWMNILLPSKTYDDIYTGWSNNQRFRAVARLEYLRSRYLDTPRYVQAKTKMLKGLTNHDEDLPKRSDVLETFGMTDWNWDVDSRSGAEDAHKNRLMRDRLRIRGTTDDAHFDLKSPVVDWELEDVLEVGGCCVHGRSEFNLFAEEHQLYEVLTLDYIETLAAKICELRSLATDKKQFQVCEVGAGSGALSHHLRRCLERFGETDIDVIATDPGTWNLGQRFAVEPYTNKQALQRFRPDLVLVSWMPAGTDWSASFRRAGVPYYVIVGEADDGCTGHNWKTWGNRAFCDDDGTTTTAAIPYNSDGYRRENLKELAALQLQRYDCAQAPKQSTTVLFTKE
jgi:hypothetical protein